MTEPETPEIPQESAGPAGSAPVKVTCPDCGHVRVAPRDVRLVVVEAPGASFYTFTCPGCDQRIRREVTKDVAGALLARRVPAIRSVGGG